MTISKDAENSFLTKTVKKIYIIVIMRCRNLTSYPIWLFFSATLSHYVAFPWPVRGAGVSCQICGVISQLSKAGKSIVYGGVKGYFQAAGFKMGTRMCSVSLNSTGGFRGGLLLCGTCSIDIMNYIIITKHSL